VLPLMPLARANATTKTRKHQDTHEEENVFFFVLSCLRGPGAVLAVVLPLMPLQEQMQPRKHERAHEEKRFFSLSC
jgi:hypothetical protein